MLFAEVTNNFCNKTFANRGSFVCSYKNNGMSFYLILYIFQQLLILTLKDLHKMHPSVNPNVPLSSIDGAGMDQVTHLLIELCALYINFFFPIAAQLTVFTKLSCIYQALQCFCDTLKSIGVIWTHDDEFIKKLDEEYSNLHNDSRRYGTS